MAEQEQPERGAGLAHVARELGARRLGPRGIGQQPRDAGLAVGRLDPAVFVARDDRHVRPAAPKVDERDVVPVDERPVGRRQRRVGVRAEDVVDGIAGVRRVVDQRGVDAVAGSQPLEVARIGPREVDFLQQAGRHVAAAVHDRHAAREVTPLDVAAEVEGIEELALDAAAVEIAQGALRHPSLVDAHTHDLARVGQRPDAAQREHDTGRRQHGGRRRHGQHEAPLEDRPCAAGEHDQVAGEDRRGHQLEEKDEAHGRQSEPHER